MTLAERLRHPFSNGHKEPMEKEHKEEDNYYDDMDEKDKEIAALKAQIAHNTEFLQHIILELINRQSTSASRPSSAPPSVPTSTTSLGSSVAKLPGPVGKLP